LDAHSMILSKLCHWFRPRVLFLQQFRGGLGGIYLHKAREAWGKRALSVCYMAVRCSAGKKEHERNLWDMRN
jgi:hypothetical protein